MSILEFETNEARDLIQIHWDFIKYIFNIQQTEQMIKANSPLH